MIVNSQRSRGRFHTWVRHFNKTSFNRLTLNFAGRHICAVVFTILSATVFKMSGFVRFTALHVFYWLGSAGLCRGSLPCRSSGASESGDYGCLLLHLR